MTSICQEELEKTAVVMSLKDVLDKLDNISDRVDTLTADVGTLKDKDKALELDRADKDTADRSRRSRSRSPIGSTARTPRSPYDRTSECHSDEDDPEGSQLMEVSEQTYRTVCVRSMSNDLRKRTRGAYKLPRVEATRTHRVDQVIKALASQSAKTADRELARLQTFVLDSLAPVSSLMEMLSQPNDETQRLSIEEVRAAVSTAAELIGNVSLGLEGKRW